MNQPPNSLQDIKGEQEAVSPKEHVIQVKIWSIVSAPKWCTTIFV